MSGSNKEEGPLTRSSAKASEFLEFLSENHPPGLLPVKLDVLREALWQEESGGVGVFPVQIRKEVLISSLRIPRLVVLHPASASVLLGSYS